MNGTQQLARKYATAWLSLFSNEMNLEQVKLLKKVHSFLIEHEQEFYYLKLSVIGDAVKHELLSKLVEQFKLPKSLDKLIDLLLEHKRMFLFVPILRAISVQYQKENRIKTFIFSSSQELSDETCTAIERFLASKTQCAIIYEKRVDKGLIAGIRLLSTTLLWEYSLAQQLRAMQNALTQ